MKKELICISYTQVVMLFRKENELLCNLFPSLLSYCSFLIAYLLLLTQKKDKMKNSAPVSWPHQRFSIGSLYNFNSCAWDRLYFPCSRSAKFVSSMYFIGSHFTVSLMCAFRLVMMSRLIWQSDYKLRGLLFILFF